MDKSVIAAQLYSLRKFTQTPKDVADTMRKVKKIGYDAVQVSGMGPIDPKELKKIVDGEGLHICATHLPYARIRDEQDKVIEDHRLWGCKYPAIGYMPDEFHSMEGFIKFAGEMNEAGKKFASAGMEFSYHNHHFEFHRYGGKTGLELLMENSDPENFKMEIDTYWVQFGGADPAQWIRKCKNRIPLVHLKDMLVLDKKQVMAEVGEGNLNWQEILKACKESNVVWYIIEQDEFYREPFESMAISLKNLRKMGVN